MRTRTSLQRIAYSLFTILIPLVLFVAGDLFRNRYVRTSHCTKRAGSVCRHY
jgi:hypothetical protein